LEDAVYAVKMGIPRRPEWLLQLICVFRGCCKLNSLNPPILQPKSRAWIPPKQKGGSSRCNRYTEIRRPGYKDVKRAGGDHAGAYTIYALGKEGIADQYNQHMGPSWSPRVKRYAMRH